LKKKREKSNQIIEGAGLKSKEIERERERERENGRGKGERRGEDRE